MAKHYNRDHQRRPPKFVLKVFRVLNCIILFCFGLISPSTSRSSLGMSLETGFPCWSPRNSSMRFWGTSSTASCSHHFRDNFWTTALKEKLLWGRRLWTTSTGGSFGTVRPSFGESEKPQSPRPSSISRLQGMQSKMMAEMNTGKTITSWWIPNTIWRASMTRLGRTRRHHPNKRIVKFTTRKGLTEVLTRNHVYRWTTRWPASLWTTCLLITWKIKSKSTWKPSKTTWISCTWSK